MADELVYENENGDQINEVFFRRTVKGIPSLITKFYLKNNSENLSARGFLGVSPASGKSYSEDMSISDSGEFWAKRIAFDVPPLERSQFVLRAIPMTTPSGFTGKAAITITGEFY